MPLVAPTAPLVPVAAPAVTPYPYGLFSVMEFTSDEDGENGITWESVVCGGLGVTQGHCVDVNVAALVENGECSNPTTIPFNVYAYQNDSFGRGAVAVAEARVRAKFLASEQYAVEQEVSALLDIATAPTAVTITGATPADAAKYALATVEQLLVDVLGAQGVIHMSRWVASLLGLDTSGSIMRTKLGTPVAAYGGFTPEQAATPPASIMVFGTGPLRGWRSADTPIYSFPRPGINDVGVMVSRSYAIGWDCAAVAVTADVSP
jgi:hypothetical protein